MSDATNAASRAGRGASVRRTPRDGCSHRDQNRPNLPLLSDPEPAEVYSISTIAGAEGFSSCPLLKHNIALGGVLKGHPAVREVVQKRMKTFSEKRWESQPAAPSAGCIFKNPATIPAGKLMDELGLKGTRVGGAVVSAEHGNFIINDGKATARDVLELIGILKAKAKAERGIDLHTEVEIIGEE